LITAIGPARSSTVAETVGLRRAQWGVTWLGITLLVYLRAARYTDGDGWWHLATGRLIAATGRVPTGDPFSWTAGGRPWVNTEWLANLLFWAGWQVAGGTGALALVAGVAAAALLGSYRLGRLRGGSPVATGVLTALPGSLLLLTTTVRPQVFTWALLVGVALLVEGAIRQDGGFHRLAGLVPLALLWSQLHGAYLYGVGLVAAYSVGLIAAAGRMPTAALRRHWGRRAGGLLALAGGMEAVAGLSPAGPAWWLYPFQGASSLSSNAWINEWQSPNFHDDLQLPLFLLIAGLLGGLGLTAWALAHSADAGAARWVAAVRHSGGGVAGPLAWGSLGLGLLGTLYQERHAPILFLIGVPVLAPLVGAGLTTLALPRLPRGGAGLLGAGLVGALLLPGTLGVGLPAAGQAGWGDGQIYPVAALADPTVARLLADPAHRLCNYYAWGGYLIWRGIPVYVDGRQYVYGEAGMAAYVRLINLQAGWLTQLDTAGVDLVLFPSTDILTGALAGRTNWQVLYHDPVATVYQRGPPSYASPDPRQRDTHPAKESQIMDPQQQIPTHAHRAASAFAPAAADGTGAPPPGPAVSAPPSDPSAHRYILGPVRTGSSRMVPPWDGGTQVTVLEPQGHGQRLINAGRAPRLPTPAADPT